MISRLLHLRFCLAALLAFIVAVPAFAADEKLPPAPSRYFNDYANVTSPATRDQLNDKLHRFEQDTSSQVVVAIYPTLPDGVEINQYCTHVFQSWHIGQKGKDNGVGLFVFTQSRQMFIVTGYGMEGALPDATCFAIIENDIKPRFKQGDYDGGLTAGVNAILAAARGEYNGTGTTADDSRQQAKGAWIGLLVILFIVSIFALNLWQAHHTLYTSGGRQSGLWWLALGQMLANSGTNRGGGGWSGGGGGGFSGGGGSTGGGGAGGSW